MINETIPRDSIDPAELGVFRFETASGSTYVLTCTDDTRTLERVPDRTVGEPMRRDNKKLRVLSRPRITRGCNANFVLEPLGEGNATVRSTNIVTSIEKVVASRAM